jgi:hypothetical protein
VAATQLLLLPLLLLLLVTVLNRRLWKSLGRSCCGTASQQQQPAL